MDLRNKTIIILGGGTSGWVSALYYLNYFKHCNIKVKLICTQKIPPIGVGEGTTPSFKYFIEDIFDRNEFLSGVDGSLKFGVRFNNWNNDEKYYYHIFNDINPSDVEICQEFINKETDISQEKIQKILHKELFNILENNEVPYVNENNIDVEFLEKNNISYAYHFDVKRLISFLESKCQDYENFELIDSKIIKVKCKENEEIEEIVLENNNHIPGDFFVNCLGFGSKSVLPSQFYSEKRFDNIIKNDSAIAFQVKNVDDSIIENYTTSTAQDYGWSWKIPQKLKTGYGYVYSKEYVDNEEKLYDDVIKTFSIDEKNIISQRKINFHTFYNEKQFYKNCLNLGLSSGFVEPLEATSIHMTLFSLNNFTNSYVNNDLNNLNDYILNQWKNVIHFIVFHYLVNSPKNDYWKSFSKNEHFKEMVFDDELIFSTNNFLSVSIGLLKKQNLNTILSSKIKTKKLKDFIFNTSKSYNKTTFTKSNFNFF